MADVAARLVVAAALVCVAACGKTEPGGDAGAGSPAAAVTSAPAASALVVPPDAAAIAERERATLLASRSPAQWKLLIEKYPDSAEAKEAKDKLARYESVCADLPALLAELDKLTAREVEIAAAADRVRTTAEIAARNDAFERAGKDARDRVGPLKDKATDVDDHAVKPGEEPAHKLVAALFWALSDVTADAAEALQRPEIESEESYDEHAKKAVADYKRALERLVERTKKDAAAAQKACAPKP